MPVQTTGLDMVKVLRDASQSGKENENPEGQKKVAFFFIVFSFQSESSLGKPTKPYRLQSVSLRR
jgi:hypothetical protein